MPCGKERWSTTSVFGVVGDDNTCLFRGPLCRQRSGRLFLVARDEPLPDDKARISIRIPLHATFWTQNQGSARRIALDRLALGIADEGSMTTSTFSTRIPGIGATGDDPLLPRFVFGVGEDTSLHPEGPFAIPPAAILAFLRTKFA
jgi:hypothetical protein